MVKSSLNEFLDKLIPELESSINLDTRSTIKSISPLLYDYKFEEKKFNKWDTNLIVLVNFFSNLYYEINHFETYINNRINFPFWRFTTIIDARANDLDKQLNDVVYRYDNVFWNAFYPPNHFECRGSIVPLTEKEVLERGFKISTKIPKHPYPDFAKNFFKGDWKESYKELCIKLLL